MPRKQELRRGTAAYNLAKAQGRLPAKSKSTKKKTGNPLSRLMGALTGKSKPKKTFVPKKTRGQGTKKPKAITTTTTPGKNVSGGTRGQKNIKKVVPSPTTKTNSRVAGRTKASSPTAKAKPSANTAKPSVNQGRSGKGKTANKQKLAEQKSLNVRNKRGRRNK